MALPTTTSDIAALLRPGLACIITDYNTYPHEYKQIFSMHTSDKEAEYEIEMKMLGAAQLVQQGQSTPYDNFSQRYTTVYLHQYFKLGFIITRQALVDNLYKDRFPLGATALKDSLREVQNIQAFNVINNGFNPSAAIGDGKSLYSNAHPIDGGLVSNTTAIPTQLNETSLEDALTAISFFRSASGLYVNNSPRKLVVPPSLKFTASRLLNSKFRTGTGNNDINAIYHDDYLSEGWFSTVFLTSPSAWVLTTDNPNGFKYYEREALDIDFFTDIDTDNLKTRALIRFSVGNSDFRSTYGSQGA